MADPRYGVAAYAFITPNHKSHLAIYRDHKKHWWVYDLFEKNGRVFPDGGANIVLQAQPLHGPLAMDRPVRYSVWAKIAQAYIHDDNSTDEKSGAEKL